MTIGKWLAAAIVCGAGLAAVAQTSTPAPQSSEGQKTPGTETSGPKPSSPSGKILFSRSDDDADPPDTGRAEPQAVPANITDEQRAALTFTAYDLDVHLNPQQHTMAARARVSVRNDGDQPLRVIALQLTSALNFEDVIVADRRLKFGQQTLNSDVDHTGQLHEAVVELPEALPPKAELKLDVAYSGTIEPSARRLELLGTPADVAAHSDWDEISADFVGLRGFGNVVWYPVSSVPALLGDGAKVFTEIAGQKTRQAAATMRMRVSAEFFDVPPTVAVLDGHVEALAKPAAMPSEGFPGVVTCSYGPAVLGFNVPALFLSTNAARDGSGIRVYARSEDAANAQGYMTAATMVRPLLEQWLGNKQHEPLTILDLPEANDAAFEQGSALFTSVAPDAPEKLAPELAHALAHAYFVSPREWLDEGVANFAGTLWIEKMHDQNAALETLEATRGALAFAEPSSPGESTGVGPGQDLLHAADPIFSRTKAAYVLWMLRDVAGDRQLAAALASYDGAADTSPEYFEHLLERANGPDPAKDLKWFFDSWVYQDRGLPELSIAGVHSSAGAHSGEYLVGVDIMNDGFAEAEVPVTVRSADGVLTERVRLPAKTRTTHRMLVQGAPREVTVNDGTVPEVEATVHKRTLIP